ncbi:MAG: NAD(+) synthase [Victivallales bacterium]|nr:NAD(+) synthase [Victivallales bacterium]
MGTEKKINSSLKIDEEKTVSSIIRYIKKKANEQSTKRAVLGLSGGIDSAVLSALLVKAFGKDSVEAYYLYDRDSSPVSKKNAEITAVWLGIRLYIKSIDSQMTEQNIYSSIAMRLCSYFPGLNRFLHRIYIFLFRETPFITSLRKGAGDLNCYKLRSHIYKITLEPIAKAFEQRHIYRRNYLEKIAEEKNAILFGAANRSEIKLGWFVKQGIDNLPYQPISGLYKTQVIQLAEYLKIPEKIVAQEISPDMMKGINDELALNITYFEADLILSQMDRTGDAERVNINGISGKEIKAVYLMNKLSEWKRK